MADRTLYLKNQERIVELTKQEEAIKDRIKEKVKEINEASDKDKKSLIKQLDDQKVLLRLKKEEVKLTNQIGDIHEQIEDEMTTEQLLSFDIAGNLKKQKDLAEKIQKLETSGADLDKKALKDLKKQKKLMDEQLDITVRNAGEAQTIQAGADKLLGTLGSSVSSLKGMYQQAKLFGRALAANPYLMILATLGAVLMTTIDIAKNTMTLSKELGLSAGQAAKLNNEIGFLQRKFLGIFGQDTNAISKSIADNFGDLNKFSEMSVMQIAKFSMGLGISGENTVKLAKSMESVLPNISNGAEAMDKMQLYAGMAKENNVGTGAVLADIADNTELFAEFGKDGGENIAKAAIQAKKLGLNLATTAKVANSLLDFESSIEKEMEASLMIGKQLNFNRARSLALEGDLAGATADVMSQIGGQAEFSKLNVLQRKALADSIGVSVDELSKMASGNLSVESDSVEPIDANTEALHMLTETLKAAGKALLFLSPIMYGVHKLLGRLFGKGMLGKLFGGGAGSASKSAAAASAARGGPNLMKTRRTASGRLDRSRGLGKRLAGTRTGAVLDKAIGGPTSKLGKAAFGQAGKGMLKRIPGLSLAFGGMDIAKGVTTGDKGAVGGGAGAIVGGALGSFLGPAGTVLGSMAGQYIGEKIGDYFEGQETLEQKEEEKQKANAKVLKETADLTKEQQAEVAAAMEGGTEAMQALVAKYDSWNPFDQQNQVAEALKVLIAKEDELIRKTEESKKAISDLTLE